MLISPLLVAGSIRLEANRRVSSLAHPVEFPQRIKVKLTPICAESARRYGVNEGALKLQV
jgi:hypothetical protein